jgi:hypothetical protein
MIVVDTSYISLFNTLTILARPACASDWWNRQTATS